MVMSIRAATAGTPTIEGIGTKVTVTIKTAQQTANLSVDFPH